MVTTKEKLSCWERCNRHREQLLQRAIFRKNRRVTGQCITINTPVNKQNKETGNIRLHTALKYSKTSPVVIQILLERGAQVNAPNKKW